MKELRLVLGHKHKPGMTGILPNTNNILWLYIWLNSSKARRVEEKKLSVIKDQVDGINVLLQSLYFIILRSNILSDNTGGI